MKWFLYRMDWNAAKQKYDKQPCSLDGQRWPLGIETVWHEDRAHVERCLDSLPQEGAACYWLGMKAEAHDTLFFLDLDHCVDEHGNLDEVASRVVHPFLAAGAYFEATSSGTGVHVIGAYTGQLPPHDNKRPAVHSYEFYTNNQGVALNRRCNQGHWSVDCTTILHNMLPEWFPPRVAGEDDLAYSDDAPREDWDGPTNDDELIAKALAAGGSVAARMGAAHSFAQLWRGECEKNSSTDLALASHLAFWTGCHAARIERLMRRSGLFRDKWNTHRTYLRQLTIDQACRTTRNVYRAKAISVPIVVKELQAASAAGIDWHARVGELCDQVNGIGDLRTLAEEFIPTLGPMGIPSIYSERLVQALSKRLKLLDAPMSLPKLRTIVSPAQIQQVDNNVVVPDWAATLCYVTKGDKFMDIATGSLMSADGFRMTYAHKMPFKPNGDREDVVKYARDRWNLPVVDDVMYRPDQPAFFGQSGLKYANKFREDSMPAVTAPSEECAACIHLFMRHLWLMSSERVDVYMALLLWIAHNVRFPGRKIRWSPLIKGVQGDGKSIVLDLIFNVMGGTANVKVTSNANLTNGGGFTDWSTGKAVNVIEEIRLVGKEKYKLFNAMKIFIGDTLVDLNMKGKPSGDSFINVTNHWGNTNYEDALPTDDTDRRWMIVFSPYLSIEDAVKAKGLGSVGELVAQFKRMGDSMRQEPGAWRGWLLGADLSGFDPDSRAPTTDEKRVMSQFSGDPVEHLVRDVIETGCPGVTVDVFCGSLLRRSLKIRAQLEDLQIPNSSAWHSLLSTLGYRPWPKQVKFMGSAQQLWVRQNFHADQEKLLEILKNTVPN